MQSLLTSPNKTAAFFATAMLLLGTASTACANEDGASLETTIKLINGMVIHGALAREKADAMIAEARRRTAVAESLHSHAGKSSSETAPIVVAAVATETVGSDTREQIKKELLAEMRGQMAADIKRQILAELTGSGGGGLPAVQGATATAGSDPATGSAGDKTKARVVRVPYVPESMRREIREQVKQEVLAQAKEERWGNPGALPEWLDRFTFEGDMRLRSDSFRLSRDNSPPTTAGYAPSNLTRAAEFAGPNGDTLNGLPGSNTQEDFNRTRLRLRFGATAKVADSVSAGFRISTGGTSGPTSTNQTQGQGFNKYSVVLDRGFITLHPTPWLTLTGGRIANPFFSTDLVWADDLNFEGVAARYSQMLTPNLTTFASAGLFPIRTDSPLQTGSRDLRGMQAGFNWRATPTTDFKLAGAVYDYHGMEGQRESAARYGPPAASDYGTRYEYPNGLRQRGNTLFILNAPTIDTTKPTYWGLASGFREFNLTGSLDIARFDPTHIVLTGDFVRNLAFDRDKIAARTGSAIVDGNKNGYMGKITVGHSAMTRWGDWNVSLAYRWLGSDAVLDAFTNSDFGMGGTNNKGYILGMSWGIDKNSWLSARWMGSQLIDSMAPKISGTTTAPTKLSVDLLQVDINAKF